MRPSRNRGWWVASVACGCLTTIGSAPLAAQTLTESELYRAAYDANARKDYLTSAIYLFAYIQRSPTDLANDATRSASIRASYDYAVRTTNDALKRGEADHAQVAQLQAQIKSLSSQPGIGSSSQGLSTPPPPAPPLPPPRTPPARGTAATGMRANVAVLAARTISMDGTWTMTLHSAVSGKSYAAQLQLEAGAGAFTGTVRIGGEGTWAVRGIDGAVGDSIDLVRDTGRETIQHFRISRGIAGVAAGVGGRFWNVGRFADSGSVVLRR